MAAAIPGFIGAIVVMALNIIIMNWFAKRNIAKGITYTPPRNLMAAPQLEHKPHWVPSVVPILLTIVLYSGYKIDIVIALAANIVLSVILFWKHFGGLRGFKDLLEPVPKQAAVILLQVGALGSIGSVVAASPVFDPIVTGLTGMNIPPMFKIVLCVALMVGICGSGPAGLSATLPHMTGIFNQMGVSMNALHRVAVFASQTLDTLPTSATMPVMCEMTDVPLSKMYKYVFITTVLNTTIASLVVALILTLFPGLV